EARLVVAEIARDVLPERRRQRRRRALRKTRLEVRAPLFGDVADQLLRLDRDRFRALDLGVERTALLLERAALGGDVRALCRRAFLGRRSEHGDARVDRIELRRAVGDDAVGRGADVGRLIAQVVQRDLVDLARERLADVGDLLARALEERAGIDPL